MASSPDRAAHRGDERLEAAVRRRPAEPALPVRVGEVEDRRRQVGLGQVAGVVGDDASPTADARPRAVRRPVAGIDEGEDVIGELRQPVLGRERPEGAGVLGEEDVGGAVVALLEDRRGELGGAAVADLDVDPALLLEAGEDRADELLAAAAVDDELLFGHRGGPGSAIWRTRGLRGARGQARRLLRPERGARRPDHRALRAGLRHRCRGPLRRHVRARRDDPRGGRQQPRRRVLHPGRRRARRARGREPARGPAPGSPRPGRSPLPSG